MFISSSAIVTAALLGGDTEMTITGGIGNVAAYVKGSTDIVFTGGVKNVMTQTLVAGGNIKRPEDLKGKRIGVSRTNASTMRPPNTVRISAWAAPSGHWNESIKVSTTVIGMVLTRMPP